VVGRCEEELVRALSDRDAQIGDQEALLSDREALTALTVLDSKEIAALPWVDVPGAEGVRQKVLWRFGDFTVALVSLSAAAVAPGNAPWAAHHHVWVVEGRAKVAGRLVAAGSYLHVPPGTEHAIHAIGPGGCTVLQVHRPHPPQEAEAVGG
jgi:mannose-6-phosphate isomerase-like protein (cupin superfamily)